MSVARIYFVPICVHCVYCVNCTKFGQLILRIIIKIDATRCQIFRLKCTKIVFSWGSAPDPAGGAYSVPPDSLAGLKGPTSKGRGGDMGRYGRRGPPIFYCTPSSSFLEICLWVTSTIMDFRKCVYFSNSIGDVWISMRLLILSVQILHSIFVFL